MKRVRENLEMLRFTLVNQEERKQIQFTSDNRLYVDGRDNYSTINGCITMLRGKYSEKMPEAFQ